MSVNDLGTSSTQAWFHSRQFCSGRSTQAYHYLLLPVKVDFFFTVSSIIIFGLYEVFFSIYLPDDDVLTNTLSKKYDIEMIVIIGGINIKLNTCLKAVESFCVCVCVCVYTRVSGAALSVLNSMQKNTS